MKRWVKYTLAVLLYYSGATALYMRRRLAGRHWPVILAYHCFLPGEDPRRRFLQPGMCVSPEVFDGQLDYIRRHFSVESLESMVDRIKNGTTASSNTLAITIDDGWQDNYEHAFPVLKKHNAPATIFLTSDYIGTDRVYWFVAAHRLLSGVKLTRESIVEALDVVSRDDPDLVASKTDLAARMTDAVHDPDAFIEILKQFKNSTIYRIVDALGRSGESTGRSGVPGRLMLSWDEIGQMASSSVTFGSHGCSHQILTLLDAESVKDELEQSAKVIGNRLNGPITLFSYPNGNYDESVEDAVRRAGYKAAVTTSGNMRTDDIDLFALRRIGVHDGISTNPVGGFSKAMFALHLARSV